MHASLIVTSCNYAGTVVAAVESALAQTVPFDEIVVVDDGSVDGSPALLRARLAAEPRARLLAKPANEGQLAAFCDGLRATSGELVFFLDADDLLEPGYLAAALARYRAEPGCDFLWVTHREFGTRERLVAAYPRDRDLGTTEVLTWTRRRWLGSVTSTVSLRRALAERVLAAAPLEDWRGRADDVLVYGASLLGGRKAFLAEPLVRYRVHGANLHCGRPYDAGVELRYELAVERLFAHFLRLRGYAAPPARLVALEFRARPGPDWRDCRDYLAAAWGAPAPLGARLRDVRRILGHWLTAPRPCGASGRPSGPPGLPGSPR